MWDARKQVKRVEPVLARIPLPVFYLSDETEEHTLVADGQQRLTTLFVFLEGWFPRLGRGSVTPPRRPRSPRLPSFDRAERCARAVLAPAGSQRPLLVALLGVALLVAGGLGAGYAEHLNSYEAPLSAPTRALAVAAALGMALAASRPGGPARALRVGLAFGPVLWAFDLHDPALNLAPLGPLLCALGALVIAVRGPEPPRRALVPAGLLLLGLGLQRPLADSAPAYPVYDPFEFVGIHVTLSTNWHTAPLYEAQLGLELALVVGGLALAAVAGASE